MKEKRSERGVRSWFVMVGWMGGEVSWLGWAGIRLYIELASKIMIHCICVSDYLRPQASV